MKTFTVPRATLKTQIADKLMVPTMFILRGFRTDSLQETHRWHSHPINADDVNLDIAVLRKGTDNTIYKGHYSFLFHAPILGGWKNFSVYEVSPDNTPFRIGWIVRDARSDALLFASIHRLLIRDTRIRLLDGPPSYKAYFFAVNEKGEQIPLKAVGHGRLGDGKFLSTRLF